MNSLWLAVWSIITLFFSPNLSAHAQSGSGQDTKEKALGLITDTADRICNVVTTKGSVDSKSASGEVRAQLDGLLRRLGNLQISGSGDITSAQYEGVLREDLTKALKESSDCKLKVFEKLVEKMLPDPDQRPAEPRAASPMPVVTFPPPQQTAPPAPSPAPQPPPAAPSPGYNVSQAFTQGHWTTRSVAECGSRFYTWVIDGDQMTFTDQSNQVDIERILERRPGGFITMTASSYHAPGHAVEAPGTRWVYQFLSNDSVRVQKLSTGTTFTLTRC